MDRSETSRRIGAYFGKTAAEPNHRYRSWEHCYQFFHSRSREEVRTALDTAALQLAFYLASWGMYRGSGFLLQRDYTIHRHTVETLLDSRFSNLWEREIGADSRDYEYAPLVLQAVSAIRDSYRPFGEASDTLVTKVLLGTLACVPACDRFFKDGLRRSKVPYAYVNTALIKRMIEFSTEYLGELRHEQSQIRSTSGVHYPLMKLVDMYFWQIGFEAAGEPVEVGE